MSSKKKTAAKRSPKKTSLSKSSATGDAALFDRVAAILEQARSGVVRAVNNHMVLAYWMIGREIVQEIQGGGKRAGYGGKVMERLSKQLTAKYGRGFSTTNLRYFRSFYNTYPERVPEIRQIRSGELGGGKEAAGTKEVLVALSQAVETEGEPRGFSPALGWSHYQALLGVEHPNERLFYEIEAEMEGWDVEHLKRQIHTFLFARLLKSSNKAGVMEMTRKGLTVQKAVDLVFYNCILKCYLLIDLKIGELSHQDVGQMDSYVRMFDDKCLTKGDNPTIGLILCTKKNETVAKYSVLKESQQLFASKYMLYLPTEEELRLEIERERKLIEESGEF